MNDLAITLVEAGSNPTRGETHLGEPQVPFGWMDGEGRLDASRDPGAIRVFQKAPARFRCVDLPDLPQRFLPFRNHKP